MKDWTLYPLGDLIENRDALRKPVKEQERTSGPFPYYGASGVVDYVNDYRFEGLHLLVAEDGENLRTRKLPVAFLADGKFWVNNHAHVVRGNEKADTRFLHYALQVADITSFLSGSTMPKLTKSNLGRIPILAPNIEEQRAIANVLSVLDDKIDLNRQQNDTLEAMAKAIFTDWFVDFGPVRRRLAGATEPVAMMGGLAPDPVRAAEMAALFPEHFGDDGLPDGWKVGKVQYALELAYGKSLPKTERSEGRVPVYGSGGVNGTHKTALVKGPGIVVGRKGTIGSLYWVQDDFFPIDTVFFVKPLHDFTLEQVWFLLGSLGLEHMNTDAAVPGLNRDNVYRLEVPIAPPSVQIEFHKFAGPLRAKTEFNRAESRTLAETRDYLLPKLLSGEVRVDEGKKIAESAPA
jgi:type I restriction enzyme, S subunit